MSSSDVVIKRTQPLRVAEMTATAPGPGPDSIGPLFARLIPQLVAVLEAAGVTPGISVGHYEKFRDDGSLVVHVGFEVASRAAVADERVSVVDLPVVTVASLLHRGPLDTLLASYEQLARWIQDNGHTSAGPSRELYHRHSQDDPAGPVTELQVVLAD